MALIINANGFHKASAKPYTQRTRSGSVTINNGSLIDYAIVATGFGGDGWAARVAQMAIDAMLVQFDRGNDYDIPTLLENAIRSANHEIYWTTRKMDDVYAHIAVAAIENEETLFIANIGANPIYLVRGERLTQLTLTNPSTAPHLDPETHYAESWDSAVGKHDSIKVDRGFHIGQNLTDAEFARAQSRGISGLPIKEGDSVIVGSQNFQTVVERQGEAINLFDLLSLYDGKDLIVEILPQLVESGVAGSFSVATLQARPGSRLDYATTIRNQLIKNPVQFYNGLAVAAVVVVALFAFVYLRNQPNGSDQLAQPSVVAKLSTPTPQDSQLAQIGAADSDQSNGADATAQAPTKAATAASSPTTLPTSPPIPTEQSAVKPKPQIVKTDEPTATTESSDSDEQTPPPTEEPQLTVTIEPITSTVVITVSDAATATIAPVQRVFPRPVLLNLNCAAEWQNYAQNSQIELNWRWNGNLYWNEYLEIRVGPRGGNLRSIGKVFAEPNGNVYQWFITPQGYFLDGVTKEFQWQVVHMAPNGRTVLAQSGRGCFTIK